jgi:hypothetical protein
VKRSIKTNLEWEKEKRYSGKWNPKILADYCWMFVWKTPTEEYKRQATIKLDYHGVFIYFY